VSSSFESMNAFFDDEIPHDWQRCTYCGFPLTLDVKKDKVLIWCKGGCRMIHEDRRVLKGGSNES